MAVCICHTDGCGNAGHEIELELSFTDDEGAQVFVGGVACGVCGHPITDITPPLPEAPAQTE